MKKIILLCSLVVLLFVVCSNQSVFAAEGDVGLDNDRYPAAIKFLRNIFQNIDFTTGITTEYDTNIFLTEDAETSDIKNTLTQEVSLEVPKDPFYLKLDYLGNLSYYMDEGDLLHDHVASFLFSYRPYRDISLGISNNFKKVASKSIVTPFGDRLLTRGYKEDYPSFEIKWEPVDKLVVDAAYSNYWIDADASNDDFIDRSDNIGKFSLTYDLWPDIAVFLGQRYYDAHFPKVFEKDALSSRVYYGVIKKFPNLFDLSTEVGHEHKHTNFMVDDSNTDARLIINSTFSVYTVVNFVYSFNRLLPSARREYFQYFSNSIDLSVEHLINPKTSVFASASVEKQYFDSSDALPGQTAIDRATEIVSFGTSLKRSLNDYLDLHLGYEFTKRNTDFTKEGYTDNKVSLSLTANY